MGERSTLEGQGYYEGAEKELERESRSAVFRLLLRTRWTCFEEGLRRKGKKEEF